MYLDGSRQQIVKWLEEGLNDREIAERLRVSRSTVRYWRERNGIERPAKTTAKNTKKNAKSPPCKTQGGPDF